jgi:hypothetical protein
MASSSNKFPVKLYNILQEADKTPYLAEILSWSADGKSFKVHQKDEFSKAILPATFGTNVYKSFQRNLHFWGYQNIRKGPSKGVCSHPFFVRDRPELLSKMRRVRAPSKNNDLDDSRSQDNAQQAEDTREGEKRGGPSAFVPGRGIPGRVVSPNTSSTPPITHGATGSTLPETPKLVTSALPAVHPAAGFLGPNTSNTAALLLLLQQQQMQQNKEPEDLQERQQQQQQQQQALAETLLVRHLLAQKEQQQLQQMRLLQELFSTGVGQIQQPSVPSSDSDQNALARTLVSQLLQQPVPPSNLLSSLLG